MRKSLFVAFLAALLLCLLMVDVRLFRSVNAGTNISGLITSDAIWQKSSSPYSLTGNLVVERGAILTIESGTTLNLNDYYIRVNGTLLVQPGVVINLESVVAGGSIQVNGILTARGTNTNPIRINGAAQWQNLSPVYSSINFTRTSIDWSEETTSGSIIENTIIDSVDVDISSSLRMTNETFSEGGIYVLGGQPVISNSVIASRISISGGSSTISNNEIKGGFISYYGKDGGENVIITDNVISYAKTTMGEDAAGIWIGGSEESGGHVLIQRNLIANNSEGIQIFRPNSEELKTSLTIQNNTIIHNNIGISTLSNSQPKIAYNDIYNNSFNIKLSQEASNNIDATNNWWGTADNQAIGQTIYDYKNDHSLGKVNYVPFLTRPNLNATLDSNAESTSIPTASPTPTTTPNPEQTPTLIPTPTEEPQQTEQFDLVIGIAIVMVIVFGSGLGLLIYLIRKK